MDLTELNDRMNYDAVKKICVLTDKLSSKILECLCFREVYRVYCEEYHVKPPYLLGSKWLKDIYTPKLSLLIDLVNKYEYPDHKDHIDRLAEELSVISIAQKMETLVAICDNIDSFFMYDIKKKLDMRAEYKFDFGMIEAEVDMEPGERLLKAMQSSDPIDKIVNIQRKMIVYITDYLFSSKIDKDFYKLFNEGNIASNITSDINKIPNLIDEFITNMKSQS